MTVTEQLRLLFLAPFAPRLDGAHGGSRAVAQLMWELSGRHRISLLHMNLPGDPPVDERLRSRCERVEAVPVQFGDTRMRWWRRRLRVAAGLLMGRPRWVSNWTDDAFSLQLEDILRSWQPQVVQAEFHVMGQYLLKFNVPGVKRILVEHEPGITRAVGNLGSSSAVHWPLAAVELWAWQRYERGIVAAADAVVVFTRRDERALARLGATTPVVTIPLATDLPAEPLNPVGVLPPRLLFAGNFMHPPNIDAAMRLIRGIFPRVQQARPDACLDLVGPRPPRELLKSAGPGVSVHGYVEDVRPYLDRAAVVVAPMRLGGGMRVKVLEALAAGKAVVASPLAVEGLAVEDGREVRIASTDEQFADVILGLLENPGERAGLAQHARLWAEVNLTPQACGARYEELYRSLLTRPATNI